MKGRQIVLDRFGGREAAALLVDGQLSDLLIAADAPAPGAIYRAVADRPMKGLGGLFLKTPRGAAYLRNGKGIRAGAAVTVQVTGYAERGKAIPVTDRIVFKSRYAIVTPGSPGVNLSRSLRDPELRSTLSDLAEAEMSSSGMGLILRSSAAGADTAEVVEDIRSLRRSAEAVIDAAEAGPSELLDGDGPWHLAWRDWTEAADIVRQEGAFGTLGVSDQIEALRDPRQQLPGGGSLFVEQTRALVAVDVNTNSDNSYAAGLKANLACLKALPRILRIRGLAGQIVIDPAPIARKDRRAVETALNAAFRGDGIATTFAGWTPLGHVELRRKRARPQLDDILTGHGRNLNRSANSPLDRPVATP